MPYDFDPWGLEDQLSSGELAYQYGGNTYGDLSPGQQSWNFDFGNWNYNPDTSNSWDTSFNPDFSALQNFQQPSLDFSQSTFEPPQLDFGGDWLSQYQNQGPEQFLLDQYTPQLNIEDYTQSFPEVQPGQEWYQEYLPESYGNAPDFPTLETKDTSLWDNIKSGLGGLGELFGKGSPLLPLLFLGSGLMSSNAAGDSAKTLQQIAQQEQAKNQAAIDQLNAFIASGQGRPNPADYGSGSTVNIGSNGEYAAYLAKLQAAIDDPRYGLQEWMDAEGGRRAEAAARKMAKSGRTGLAPMTTLETMRDYLGSGRKAKIAEMQGLAGLYNARDIASMQAAAQQANAQIAANASRYNADMGYYSDVMRVLQQQADPSNYINTLLASQQAQGQQYNPLLNSIAMWMGR